MNTGAYNATLTRQVANGFLNASAGSNALSNPYPSPISWTSLLALNAGQTTGSAFMFKTTGLNTGQWAAINSSGVGTNGATNNIASMQGFMVRKATSGSSTFTINNTVRNNTYANNGNFLRSVVRPLVRLQMTNGTFADEAVMYAEPTATGKIDLNFDADKWAGEADKPYLGFISESQDLSIVALASLPTGTAQALAVRGNGVFTLQISEKEMLSETIYLLDRRAGKLHDLTEGYTFQARGAENNRFVLFVGKPSNEQLGKTGEPVRIWTNEKTLFVRFADLDLATASTAEVFNAQGQNVLKTNAFREADTQMVLNLPTGVYVVRVQNASGVTTQKVFVQ